MSEIQKPPSIGNDTVVDYLNAIWQAAKTLAANAQLKGITNTDGDLIQDAEKWAIDANGLGFFANDKVRIFKTTV